MQVTSKQGQWMGDIAVREAGSIEAMVEMAIKNDRSITGKMAVGSTLLKPTPIDRRVMNYYKINNLYPATAMEPDGRSSGGIGYMAVGITFTVS
ncbi:MAG: hypothetical protein LBJ47_09810 [Tannerella sp.]|jgi:hypothetical protein|nr:hypothetical protein [Tannerella sp.]